MAIGGEKALLLAVMRNEGPYIIEWMAHHFALGIDDLLVFTNFCTDNTDKILDRIEEMDFAVFAQRARVSTSRRLQVASVGLVRAWRARTRSQEVRPSTGTSI